MTDIKDIIPTAIPIIGSHSFFSLLLPSIVHKEMIPVSVPAPEPQNAKNSPITKTSNLCASSDCIAALALLDFGIIAEMTVSAAPARASADAITDIHPNALEAVEAFLISAISIKPHIYLNRDNSNNHGNNSHDDSRDRKPSHISVTVSFHLYE